MTPGKRKKYNLLLVDDNPQNLTALSRILKEHDYHVRTAINGQVALKSVQNMLPDLILLDIRMPGMDGYTVCQQLKNDENTREIPVVFLSALDAPLDKVTAFEAGGVDYITKPFQMDEVVARVKTHITLRAMQEQFQVQNIELRDYRDHLESLVEQRTAELQVSEQQYRSLAEHVKDGIVIVQAGKIVFSNTVFASMCGYSVELLFQRDLVRLFPESMQQNIQVWLNSERTSTSEKELEVEIITGQQQKMWVELEQSDLMWNGQTVLLLTIRDVHEAKLREIRLEQERSRLQQENLRFKSSLMERYRFGQLIGKSPAMQHVYELIISAAASDVNVLITGESGTGKELIARTLHQVSRRKDQAFVPVNCASIPETLFEREFFGHRKGTFTGADRDKPGFFDQAHQGVLFLDEVTELQPGMQAKLLRVLQDGEYIPLGNTTPKQADVLLVAATNKAWEPLIQQGSLREDFFYRVCVIEINVPPLRERKDDLTLLIEHFLEQFRHKRQTLPEASSAIPATLPGQILEALYVYDWPGNVRELQNTLQRYLATHHLDEEFPLIKSVSQKTPDAYTTTYPKDLTLPEAMKAVEKQMIIDALIKNQHHKINTAKMLGIPRSTLHRKIKEFHLGDHA